MKKDKETTLPVLSAEAGDGIYAETQAEVSNPQQGDTDSFDAGSNKEKTAEFEKLIEGKYKTQFAERVRKILSRRLKEVKELKEKADKNAEIAQLVMGKFNVNDGDTEKLERVIDEIMNRASNNDNMRNTELLKRLIKENSLLKQDRETRMRDMRMKSFSDNFKSQVEETVKAYPEFDLRSEIIKPEFSRLVKAGVSVKNAYEVLNIEKILEGKSKETEKRILDTIRYKGQRPVENGSENGGGILLSGGISKLNKKQRAELAKRAASGEKIEF